MVRLSSSQIAKLIYPAGFYKTKSENIIKISKILIEEYHGLVPDDLDRLLTLPGVGLKTANLVLAQGFKIPANCVDTHVHRIMNRIGYIDTDSANDTEKELRHELPEKHWLTINSLLVNFGREICKPVSPLCSKCPLDKDCPKVGVFKSR
jgi:endonuclease-3